MSDEPNEVASPMSTEAVREEGATEAEIVELQTREAEVAALKEKNAALKVEMERIQSEMAAAEAEKAKVAEGVQEQLAKHQAVVRTVSATQQAKLDAINAELAELEEKLATAKAAHAEAHSRINFLREQSDLVLARCRAAVAEETWKNVQQEHANQKLRSKAGKRKHEELSKIASSIEKAEADIEKVGGELVAVAEAARDASATTAEARDARVAELWAELGEVKEQLDTVARAEAEAQRERALLQDAAQQALAAAGTAQADLRAAVAAGASERQAWREQYVGFLGGKTAATSAELLEVTVAHAAQARECASLRAKVNALRARVLANKAGLRSEKEDAVLAAMEQNRDALQRVTGAVGELSDGQKAHADSLAELVNQQQDLAGQLVVLQAAHADKAAQLQSLKATQLVEEEQERLQAAAAEEDQPAQKKRRGKKN
ncbi:hypothetical protein DIPPA_29190 [Diplonema papillatum]|nr:hypothetical protein DIPPA_13123 [Diplonema papillatum]KAJ9461070.1 hypothetical protein DIPPA_29190 [Diplonema papillatum]